MNIYVWASECLKNYGRGKIIVTASSLEEARERAMKGFHVWYLDYNPWSNLDGEDDQESYREKMAEMVADIGHDPEILPVDEPVYVMGSE